MEQNGITWVVAADGAHARIFEERARLGPLRELETLHMRSGEEDHVSGSQRATVHQRQGEGRHASGDPSPAEEAEVRFLRRVANRLNLAATRGDYDRLVIMAPPRALGRLREALAPAVMSRVEVSDPHERSGEDAHGIRERLRAARGAARA